MRSKNARNDGTGQELLRKALAKRVRRQNRNFKNKANGGFLVLRKLEAIQLVEAA